MVYGTAWNGMYGTVRYCTVQYGMVCMVGLYVCLFVWLVGWLVVCMYVGMCVCILSISLSVCLPVCLNVLQWGTNIAIIAPYISAISIYNYNRNQNLYAFMTRLVLLVHNNWDTYGITMTHVRHLIDPNCQRFDQGFTEEWRCSQTKNPRKT